MGDDQPVVLLVTYMGSTSMFHDISPDANGAASNNLALLLSAHLISSALDDGALDALHGRIAFWRCGGRQLRGADWDAQPSWRRAWSMGGA